MINQSFYSSIPTKLDLNGPYMSFTTIPSGISGNPGSTVSLTGIATASFLGVGATTVNDGVVLYRWYEVGVGALSDGNRLSGTSTNTLTISNLQSPGDSNRRFYLEAKYQSTAYKNRLDGKNGNHISPANSDQAAASVIAPQRPRPTASITASSTSIAYNGSVTISWSTTNADRLDSNFGTTKLTDTQTFSNQTSSRTFRITAYNSAGSDTKSVSVNVASPITPSVNLSVSPSSIENGGSTTVTWSSTNASSVVSSNFGATEVNGTLPLTNQTQSKTFSITVRSVDGVQRTASATLTVAAAPVPDPPPTVNFSASPSSIENGGSTTLTWSTSNATSLSSNFGVTDLNGTKTLTGLVETKEFEVIASGSGGTTRATATVTVAAPLPVIVITSQPSPVSATFNKCSGGGGSVNFSVGASVNNPTGETLSYQWYLNGSALSNSANVDGAQSSTLTLRVLENQSGNNNVYVRVSYSKASTEQSNNVPYSVTVIEPRPSLSITSQPTNQTVFVDETATFSVQGSISDGRAVAYQWYFSNGNAISGANESIYRVTPTSAGTQSFYAVVSDPQSTCTAVPALIESNIVTLTANEQQKIIRAGLRNDTSTFMSYSDINLSTFTFGTTGNYEFYSPFEDLTVDILMEGGSAPNKGSFTGGQGGRSIVRLTLRRNTEYTIRAFASTESGGGGSTVLYEKARLLAVVGGGGGAGTNGNGGNGGGVGLSGQSGSGFSGGNGGSTSARSLGYFPGGESYCAPNKNLSFQGGIISSCTIGDGECEYPEIWYQIDPCTDYGGNPDDERPIRPTIAYNLIGQQIVGSATLSRGFKPGIGHRNNGGFAQSSNEGPGGYGAGGGNAGTPFTSSGGGGGGGYANGVSIIQRTTGGRIGSAQFTIALPGRLRL